MSAAELTDGRRVTALGTPGSRALVAGTGSHVAGSRLPGVPAVAGTVAAVGRALAERCGLDPGSVRTLVDPADPKAFLRALAETAAAAEDVLLLYYVGHGLVGHDGELYLATHETEDTGIGLAVEALSYATVREALTACRARSIMVVLDCCFSGRARGSFGTAVADAFEQTYVHGSFLLSSASATEQALAPEGDEYTAFTGELLRFLRDGDPGAPRQLTFEDAYRHLSRALPRRGLPPPHRRAGDRAGELMLAPNPAARPVTRNRPEQQPGGDAAITAGTPCPYRGLSPFTAADATYFFGREKLVAEALVTLAARADTGPVAIVGRSGSGKSSLLQAGLLPAVTAGRLPVPGSRGWPQLVMTPGEQPLSTLAARFAQPVGMAAEAVHAELTADPGRFKEIAATALRCRAGHVPGSRLVLAVDQFEELFTACRDEGERHQFIRALFAASDGADRAVPPLLLILGIRADFYGHCTAYPELVPMLKDGLVPVQPMDAAQLRAAIVEPAGAAGLGLEGGLADRLLQDLRAGEDSAWDSGGALPLLSYALQATWQHSDGRLLTLANYHDTGGIWQAVTQRADSAYGGLDDAAQGAVRRMLLGMVRLGEGTEDVRRQISLAQLLAGSPADEAAAIARAKDALVDARLITVADDSAEITHEALLRAWPRLRGWIQEDRAGLLARQRLAEAAHAWQSENREPGSLYSGVRLEVARQWRDDTRAPRGGPGAGSALGPLEREFLDASIRRTRGQARRRRAVRILGVVVPLMLAAVGVFAYQQRVGERDSEAERASVQLAAEADTLRGSDPAGAAQLSLTAYSSAATPQARTSLYKSDSSPYPVSLPGRFRGAVVSVAYAAGGRTVAGSWAGGTVRLWNVTDPFHPAVDATLKVGTSSALAFSPDGQFLAVHTQRGLQVWDVRGPARPFLMASVPIPVPVPPSGQFVPVAFSPNGAAVATGNGNGSMRLWNVADPRHPVLEASVAADAQAVTSVAFSPDGQSLATASSTPTNGPGGGRVRLWNVRDPRRPAVRVALAVNSAVAVAFSPVGHLLASAGVDSEVHEWNVADPGHPRKIAIQDAGLGNTADFVAVAFRPDGQVFVTADTAGRTDIWADQGSVPDDSASLPDPAGSFSAEFSPSGQQLVTGDKGGLAKLWIMPAQQLPGSVQTDGPGSPFGHNGTLLATAAPADASGNPTGAATLWDISNPLRPTAAATLPRRWTRAAFLPDGRTLLTQDAKAYTIRLWDTTDPRRPAGGATIAETDLARTNPHTISAEAVAASEDHLLAISIRSGDAVQVWDVRDIRRPVLDATIKPSQAPQSLWFLDDHELGVVGSAGMQLWDLADPRHPARDGLVENVGGGTLSYDSSRHLLTAASTDSPGTGLWDLTNLHETYHRENQDIPPDADTIAWIGDRTVAGAAAGGGLVQLWDVTRPGKPTVLAGFATSDQVQEMDASPDGQWLAGGVSSASALSDMAVDVWNVSGGHRSLSLFAQLPGDSTAFAFGSGSHVVATNDSTIGQPSAALVGYDIPAVLYPLNTGMVYRQLCAMTKGAAVGQNWRQYLPQIYYRPACS